MAAILDKAILDLLILLNPLIWLVNTLETERNGCIKAECYNICIVSCPPNLKIVSLTFSVYPCSSNRSLCQRTRSTLSNVMSMLLKVGPPVGHRVGNREGHKVGHGLHHGLPHVLSTSPERRRMLYLTCKNARKTECNNCFSFEENNDKRIIAAITVYVQTLKNVQLSGKQIFTVFIKQSSAEKLNAFLKKVSLNLYLQVNSQFLAGSMKRIEKPFLLRCP